jgi:hypothetical protein
MMHLVKNNPEPIGMTDAVPPVKKESADQPANKTFQRRYIQIG